MVANKRHKENLLERMAIIINERDKEIGDLNANNARREYTQSQVIKTLEQRIRQMHRASLAQKGLIANLQNEVERRGRVIGELELKVEDLARRG
jgi:hypothetical protein